MNFLARLALGALIRLIDRLHLGELPDTPDEHVMTFQPSQRTSMCRAVCSCGEWCSPWCYQAATARQHWRDHVRAVEG